MPMGFNCAAFCSRDRNESSPWLKSSSKWFIFNNGCFFNKKIKNKIKNINMTRDWCCLFGFFCLVWIAWWPSLTIWWLVRRGGSDLVGSVFTGLMVTSEEWQSISPLWSWPVTIFRWYFHEQSLSHISRSPGQPCASSRWCSATFTNSWSSALHGTMLTAPIHPIRALYSLPGSYYLGKTQDYEAKKKNQKGYQVQNTKNPDCFGLSGWEPGW